jgi:hypothetical protein
MIIIFGGKVSPFWGGKKLKKEYAVANSLLSKNKMA